jgi:hypothetical protein
VMPALLTSTSTPPKAPITESSAASQSGSDVTSQRTGSAEAPSASISTARVSMPSDSLSRSASRAPSRAKRRASAEPIPPAAPVMTTVSSRKGMLTPVGVVGVDCARFA